MASDTDFPSSASDSSGSSTEELQALASRLKQAIEEKAWDDLRSLLPIDSVWLIDRNRTVDEAVQEIQHVLEPAADIQIALERVLKADVAADTANLSVVSRILWSDETTWNEHDAEVEMHLGFRRNGDEWKFSSLGFTRAAAPPSAASVDYLQMAEGYLAAERYLSADFESARMMLGDYFGMAFTDVAAKIAPPPDAGPSHALIYLPVFVPTHLLARHLPQ